MRKSWWIAGALLALLAPSSGGAAAAPAAGPPGDEGTKPRALPPGEVAPVESPRAAGGREPAAGRPAEGAAGDAGARADGVAPPGPFPLPDNLPDRARFVVVKLHDEVSLGMAAFIERVTGALEPGDVLVLDINTFGGRVDAAVAIRDALLHAEDRGARVVAYVNPRAISAGALISLAADVIVVSPGSTIGAATPVQVGQGGDMQPVGEKVVSYMRQEMRATAEARGRNGDIAEAMVDPDAEVPGLDEKGKTLTLDGKLALDWGIASFEAKHLDDVFAGLGYGGDDRPYTVIRKSWSWAEKLAGWLSSSTISAVLMSLGMLGIMIGLYTGGSPIALGLGGTCLALFFFGHHVVDLAGIEDVLLFLAGVGLIVVEFVVPGHIVFGVAGLLLVLVSLFLGLIDFDKVDFAVQWEAGYVSRALSTVFGSILATVALAVAAFKFLPDTRLGRGLMLDARIDARAADRAGDAAEALVGAVGTAATDLRPAGKVAIAGKRYDARAETGYIEAGTPVQVVRRESFYVVVRPRRDGEVA
ncbi:MAG: hypothetical protein D6689_07365 [Deltaproteobacteria bacterium]|nr:MAG: hypothetical protein D6689_07365 [Deltaproteobacteria bacterium]